MRQLYRFIPPILTYHLHLIGRVPCALLQGTTNQEPSPATKAEARTPARTSAVLQLQSCQSLCFLSLLNIRQHRLQHDKEAQQDSSHDICPGADQLTV